MTPRFIGFRWTPTDAKGERRARAMGARLGEDAWMQVLNRRGVLFFLHRESAEEAILLPHEFGFIVGPLFDRETDAPVNAFSGLEAEALAVKGGASLTNQFWGPYCAILHNCGYDFLHVLRDPGGGAPVYAHVGGELSCVFSEAEDFIAVWDEPIVCDEGMLEAYLVQPRLVTRRTALAGVSEVLAGERLTWGRTSFERALAWRPDRVEPCLDGDDFEAAAKGLRVSVEASARAWSNWARMRRAIIAHRLSGGLDSSIVLAALAGAPARGDIICFNEVPRGAPEGDERPQARDAAALHGCELVEVEARPEDVDYAAILAAPLPARPTHSEFSCASSVLGGAIAARGARLVSSGQGGDQVLHRSRSLLAAVDAARDGLAPGVWFDIARDAARLARTPIWSLFEAMLAHGLLRKPLSAYNPVFAQASLAAVQACACAQEEWRKHPWTAIAAHSTPARAARLFHVADLAYYHQPSALSRQFMMAPVLASQPVVETVLSIAPYRMTQGGADRALARAAFADMLPPSVRARSTKGDTTRFHARVLERQLPLLREVLLGGFLVSRGLVDKSRIETTLARAWVADGAVKGALMAAFMAEAWLRRFERALEARRGADACAAIDAAHSS